MLEKMADIIKPNRLDKEIESVLEQMSLIKPDSKEYTAMADNLEKLYKAKAQNRVHHLSPDTVAVVACNLLGLAMIMNYEKTDIITSKALGFIMRGRA